MFILLFVVACSLTAQADDLPRSMQDIVKEGIVRSQLEYEATFDNEWNRTDRHRMQMEGLTNLDECQRIISLTGLLALQGRQCISTHEIFGNKSPYTPREIVTSIRAVQAVRYSNAHPESAEEVNLFLGIAARVRARIMNNFNLTSAYYHLTEMVCRKPRVWDSVDNCVQQGCTPFCSKNCNVDCARSFSTDEDMVHACSAQCLIDCHTSCTKICTDTEWLSHPVHADANPDDCDMLDDGVCVRRLPEDYTSHLYLNDNFDGGDFFFTNDPSDTFFQTVNEGRVLVKPKCGVSLAYSSGFENLHGVTGITQGERCLITLWLTPDERKAEELPLPDSSPFIEGRKRGPGRGATLSV